VYLCIYIYLGVLYYRPNLCDLSEVLSFLGHNQMKSYFHLKSI